MEDFMSLRNEKRDEKRGAINALKLWFLAIVSVGITLFTDWTDLSDPKILFIFVAVIVPVYCFCSGADLYNKWVSNVSFYDEAIDDNDKPCIFIQQ